MAALATKDLLRDMAASELRRHDRVAHAADGALPVTEKSGLNPVRVHGRGLDEGSVVLVLELLVET